jgi:dienelactone hydrolase
LIVVGARESVHLFVVPKQPVELGMGFMSGSVVRLGIVALGLMIAVASMARAQQEFPPPQGKGRVVVVASGATGPAHYQAVTQEIAKLGYDAVLFDSNAMEGTHGAAVRASIGQALQFPHALPGKVALVGFSLGGGMDLAYGTELSDVVAVAVLWYPLTSIFPDIQGFAPKIKVPVVMFAGEADSYKGCCLVGTARNLAAAAAKNPLPFELTTYPQTEHDFVYGGEHYNPKPYADALQRMAAALKQYLGP